MKNNEVYKNWIATSEKDLPWCVLKLHTGIPRFTLLMWGHKIKTEEAKTA